tara:strand:+ start:11580 stop:12305 length:726 start_codon:yes stop_codon:yes gene_type:complete
MFIGSDGETGGFRPENSSLLTAYFAVLDKDGELIDELDLSTKPDDGEYKYTQEALDVNGIDLKEHDKIAITYTEASKLLIDFLEKHTESGKNKLTLLGQNVGFDRNFFIYHLLMDNESLWQKYFTDYIEDTLLIAGRLKNAKVLQTKGGKLKLESLCEVFSIPLDAHKAKDDTLATIEVWKRLKLMIKEERFLLKKELKEKKGIEEVDSYFDKLVKEKSGPEYMQTYIDQEINFTVKKELT